MKIKYKKIFFKATLFVEVLITFVIIGVIASMTIPVVIKSHKKKMYASGLKKNYETISSAFAKTMEKNGTNKLSETPLFSPFFTIPSETITYKISTYTVTKTEYDYKNAPKPFNTIVKALSTDSSFRNEFEKVFQVSLVYDEGQLPVENNVIKYTDLNNEDFFDAKTAIVLSDGTHIIDMQVGYIYTHGRYRKETKLWDAIGELAVDVNGPKKPNQLGRDLFFFIIGNNGILYPDGGEDFALYNGCTREEIQKKNCAYYWKNNKKSIDGCNLEGDVGRGCPARIMEQGWKMTY